MTGLAGTAAGAGLAVAGWDEPLAALVGVAAFPSPQQESFSGGADHKVVQVHKKMLGQERRVSTVMDSVGTGLHQHPARLKARKGNGDPPPPVLPLTETAHADPCPSSTHSIIRLWISLLLCWVSLIWHADPLRVETQVRTALGLSQSYVPLILKGRLYGGLISTVWVPRARGASVGLDALTPQGRPPTSLALWPFSLCLHSIFSCEDLSCSSSGHFLDGLLSVQLLPRGVHGKRGAQDPPVLHVPSSLSESALGKSLTKAFLYR